MIRSRWRVLATRYVPDGVRHWIRARQRQLRAQRVRVGTVDMKDLRRLAPISRVFAIDRGLGVDRYYIERFLERHVEDVGGRVLEIGDDRYTRRFGGGRVSRSDILNVSGSAKSTSIVADLTRGSEIPPDVFDCILCTQTLQMIYDVGAAVRTLHRILRPGGVLLVTGNGIQPVGRREGIDEWGEYWRLTEQGLRRLLSESFTGVEVATYGNVLTAVAYLHGLAAEELTRSELDHRDADYEVIVAARAIK